jgi:hypothetical protein
VRESLRVVSPDNRFILEAGVFSRTVVIRNARWEGSEQAGC